MKTALHQGKPQKKWAGSLRVGWMILALAFSGLTLPVHGMAAQEPSANVMLVQSAQRATVAGSVLTLHEPEKISWFGERPARGVGAITTAEYLKAWEDSADDFAKNPPNSVFTADNTRPVVIELNSVSMKDGEFIYEFSLISGSLEDGAFSNAALTIDVICIPCI